LICNGKKSNGAMERERMKNCFYHDVFETSVMPLLCVKR